MKCLHLARKVNSYEYVLWYGIDFSLFLWFFDWILELFPRCCNFCLSLYSYTFYDFQLTDWSKPSQICQFCTINLFKEYMKFLNRLYDITWFRAVYSYYTAKCFVKSVNCSKSGYTSITCSKISNIPYNLILTTQFNDSSILITIISCDYLNLSLANEYVDDVTMPTQVIKNNHNFLQADQPIRLQYSNQITWYNIM